MLVMKSNATEKTSPEPGGGGSPSCGYRLRLKGGRDRSVLRRHPWIFSGAIDTVEEADGACCGDLGEVLSASGQWLGIAVVNPSSQLIARMLRFDRGPVDRDWFIARLRAAADLRRRVVPEGTTAFRLVNAEGDGLPGLVVDRYQDYLVVQCMALGMSRLEALWLPALAQVFEPRGILDRSERSRHDSNLARKDRLLQGEAPPERVEVVECGMRFAVDLIGGQKTGFYLDQRENRRLVGSMASGARVLNGFAYTGGFGVAAGANGAREVVNVETSSAALELAKTNWQLNGFPEERLRLVHGQVQEILRNEEQPFNLIILDPPAYAKDRRHVERASRAYKDVNMWAMKRLAPGGYLTTFSCSQHVSVDLFQKIIFSASLDAGRPMQWLARLGAGPDHPVHLDHPQGEYLKGLLLRSFD